MADSPLCEAVKMSINENKCFYCDVIIITLQYDGSQQYYYLDVGIYINPNIEIALEGNN